MDSRIQNIFPNVELKFLDFEWPIANIWIGNLFSPRQLIFSYFFLTIVVIPKNKTV